MSEYVYVDFSNLCIQARFLSPKLRHLAPGIVYDKSYQIDFYRLHDFLAGPDKAGVKRCALFGSEFEDLDACWLMAQKAGFETKIYTREFDHGEKMVDTALATAIIKDAYTVVDKSKDTLTLVSGDADFVPPVQTLLEDGFRVEVCFWNSIDWELKKIATKFVSLDAYFEHLAFDPAAPRKAKKPAQDR